MAAEPTLSAGKEVTLDASGNGTIEIGPNSGPPVWHVTKILVQTDRPGQAPVPKFEFYLDQQTPAGRKGLTYDGSFDESDLNLRVTRGQKLICVWTGGQAGDVASVSLDGERLMS